MLTTTTKNNNSEQQLANWQQKQQQHSNFIQNLKNGYAGQKCILYSASISED